MYHRNVCVGGHLTWDDIEEAMHVAWKYQKDLQVHERNALYVQLQQFYEAQCQKSNQMLWIAFRHDHLFDASFRYHNLSLLDYMDLEIREKHFLHTCDAILYSHFYQRYGKIHITFRAQFM